MAATSIIPTLRYHDPKSAIDFLCQAFGFEKKSVFEEDGIIIHAELNLGNAMIMIGSTGYQSPFSQYLIHPDDTKGKQTMTAYIVVNDPDGHYERAKEAGAEILLPLTEQSYGGKDYTCSDSEGYIWSFGSYDPWEEN